MANSIVLSLVVDILSASKPGPNIFEVIRGLTVIELLNDL